MHLCLKTPFWGEGRCLALVISWGCKGSNSTGFFILFCSHDIKFSFTLKERTETYAKFSSRFQEECH